MLVLEIAAGIVLGYVLLHLLALALAVLAVLPDVIREDARRFATYVRGPVWSPGGKEYILVLASGAAAILVWVALLP